jgi:hypothetical protein
MQWEYTKIDLNQVPPRGDDLDLLERAGKDGWQLVFITVNHIAYMKRQSTEAAPIATPPQRPAPIVERRPSTKK